MKQLITIKLIQKCKQDLRTLSLQETDDVIGVKENYCSTFLSKSGLLAQGEYNSPNFKSRNAVVTFRDPKTAEVKGKNYLHYVVFVVSFLMFVTNVTP